MLYIVAGKNREMAKKRARSYLDVLKNKRPDSSYIRLTSLDEVNYLHLLQTQGLFDERCIVFLDGVCENVDNEKGFEEYLIPIHESTNAFVCFEESFPAKIKQKIKKHGIKYEEFERKEAKAPFFNIFSVADAFACRNKKRCLVLLYEAEKEGVVGEEVLSVLEWQIRALLLAQTSKTADDAGLKPFVFNKAKKHGNNFSKHELKTLLAEMVGVKMSKLENRTPIYFGVMHLVLSRL